MEWKETHLDLISESIQTGPFGSQLHQYDYSEKGTPVIMPKDMIGSSLIEDSIARISNNHVQRLKKHIVKTGDIIYSRRGDVGRCVLISSKENGWICGTGCLKVTLDIKKVVPSFIFYVLQRKESVEWVENHAVGATMPNLNTGILSSLPIVIPPRSTQQMIVSILSNYDTLIDINAKRIKLLEESARELYKEWFVRMRFPGYENTKFVKGIPAKWKIGCLKDISTLLSQRVKSEEVHIYVTTDNMLKDFKGVDYKELINKPEGKVCYFEKGDILMSNIRPYFKKLWYANQQGGCSADVLIFRANKDIDTHFLFYTMCTDYFIDYVVAGSNGTKMPRGNKVFTMNFPVLVPSKELMGLFRENVSTIYSTIETLQLQNQKLAATRDRLLPRLLSGELKVKA